jgi:apolipoprotein N-acyltransferase
MNSPASVLDIRWARTERLRGLWRAAGMPLAQVLASAWLFRIAVPPDPVAPAAWVALVPLLLALRGASLGRAALTGYAFGLISLAAMHSWFFALPGANLTNSAALFGYLALYPAVWCAALAAFMRRNLPWVLPAAVAWVALDWLRSHAGFLAIPWDPLAHSQVGDVPVLQLAALGGAPLVSFAVCLANSAFARVWSRGSLAALIVPLAGIAAVHLLGYIRIPDAQSAPSMRVAIIQPADDAASSVAKLERLRAMTLSAAGERPNLIVWPESAVDRYAFDPPLQRKVADIARDANTPILFGSADFGKFAKAAGANDGTQFKNQAYLLFPDGATRGPYVKRRLVPFGEYMPLEGRFAWPRWFVARQLHGIAGSAPGIFRLDGGAVIGVVICWENQFAYLSDALVRAGAGLVVQLSDDSDFGASAEPEQHNAATVLRAVETGRSWVQMSANGPSFSVDAYGRIGATLGPLGAARWAIVAAPLAYARTPYERVGLLWLWLAAIAALAQVVVALLRSSQPAEVES